MDTSNEAEVGMAVVKVTQRVDQTRTEEAMSVLCRALPMNPSAESCPRVYFLAGSTFWQVKGIDHTCVYMVQWYIFTRRSRRTTGIPIQRAAREHTEDLALQLSRLIVEKQDTRARMCLAV